MLNSCKEFSISEAIKNISRFVDKEEYSTNIEERFNIPWLEDLSAFEKSCKTCFRRIEVKKTNEYFGFYLKCEKEECENRKWSIDVEYKLKLISCNGKSFTRTGTNTFEWPIGNGWPEFISWKELESDYVVDDSVVVEAHVKIIKITYSPCIENKNQKIFLLHHTVKNVSSIEEEGYYLTETEKRFNIPWQLKIERKNGFFGLYLHCTKELSNKNNWTIEVEEDLRLVSLNGQSLSMKGISTFEKPYGYGYRKFIRWDDMEKKYMVNDSVIIGALVKITKMSGCEEE